MSQRQKSEKKQCTLKWFSPSQVQNSHFNTPNGQCFHFLMNQLEPDEKFYSSSLRIGYEKERKKERKTQLIYIDYENCFCVHNWANNACGVHENFAFLSTRTVCAVFV